MAHRLLYHPAAVHELEALYDDVAERASPETAFRVVSGIEAYCEDLRMFPERDWIAPGLRIVGFRGRVGIAFAVKGDALFILGIFGRGRDITAELIEERLDELPES